MTRKSRKILQQKTFYNIMSKAHLMRNGNNLTDINLQCEDHTFPAHKIILAASSPFFAEYFQRKENNTKRIVNLKDVKSDIIRILLDYFYTGRINIEEGSTNLLLNLVEVAIKFQIPLVYFYCLKLFLGDSSSKDYLQYWTKIADTKSQEMEKVYMEFLLENLSFIKDSPESLSLSSDQMDCLLSCPGAATCDQEEILKFVMKWMKHHPEIRKEHLTKYLKKIDFNQINVSFSIFENEPLLMENNFYLRLYIDKLKKRETVKTKEDMKQTKLRNMKTKKFSESSSSGVCQKSKEIPNSYFLRTGMKSKRPTSFLILKHKRDETCCLYDFKNDVIKIDLGKHPIPGIQYPKFCGFNNCIFMFEKNCCYAYDIEGRKWLKKKKMRDSGCILDTVKLKDRIYVLREMNTSLRGNTLEYYDPLNDTWHPLCDLSFYDNLLAGDIISTGDNLIANIDSQLFEYSPQTDQWYSKYTVPINTPNTFNCFVFSYCKGNFYFIDLIQSDHIFIFDTVKPSVTSLKLPFSIVCCKRMINISIDEENCEILVACRSSLYRYIPPDKWIPITVNNLNAYTIEDIVICDV